MSFVLDCSVTMSWCFEDKMTPETDAVYTRTDDEAVVVPYGWFGEVINALIVGERRGRISANASERFLQDVQKLPSTIDLDVAESGFNSLPLLCRRHQLTAYDATYLELAMRMALPLATLDDALIRAAKAENVELILKRPA
jgi:predicted nucleic acid-binding protein